MEDIGGRGWSMGTRVCRKVNEVLACCHLEGKKTVNWVLGRETSSKEVEAPVVC